MLKLAEAAVLKASLQNSISLIHGSVASMPFKDESFDFAMSINVGCNLPNKGVIFKKNIKEIARSLKKGGGLVITAPMSFGVVFTNGAKQEEVMAHVNDVLRRIIDPSDDKEIIACINELTEVHRATFTVENQSLVLVRDESSLASGQIIWRKLPGLTVPNYYHSVDEYIKALDDTGLRVIQLEQKTFADEQERSDFNEGRNQENMLGAEYLEHPSFVVIHAVKN